MQGPGRRYAVPNEMPGSTVARLSMRHPPIDRSSRTPNPCSVEETENGVGNCIRRCGIAPSIRHVHINDGPAFYSPVDDALDEGHPMDFEFLLVGTHAIR